MAVRVNLDQGQINALLRSPSGPVGREMYRRGKRVEALAKRLVPVDEGRLRGSINADPPVVRGGVPVVRVGTRVRYARWVHDGTGLYGPRHTRIYPKTAKALRFRPKGSPWIFRRSVAGMRGTPYLKEALVAAKG
jgi:hypothetical protein